MSYLCINHEFSKTTRACIFCGKALVEHYGYDPWDDHPLTPEEVEKERRHQQIREMLVEGEIRRAQLSHGKVFAIPTAVWEEIQKAKADYERERGAPKPEPIHGPPTFRDWLEHEYRKRYILYYGECEAPKNTEDTARIVGYDGIGLFLYPDAKAPITYSHKQPICWMRWIILGSATGISAAILLSDWMRF